MGIINDVLDWASNKVKDATGENERRRLVSEIKENYETFKRELNKKLEVINKIIENINAYIRELNVFRKKSIKPTIEKLEIFLNNFGKAKSIGDYAPEQECPPMVLPERKLTSIEDYITEIDWTSEDVFNLTLFSTPIGATIKTKKQNILLNESLAKLKFEANATLQELNVKEFNYEQEKRIAELYSDSVKYIITTINEKIIPEIELIEAFFAAIEIQDRIIASKMEKSISSIIDITLLQNTKYHKHYIFIKNTFMFYVMACKIYNTPILTRLLNGNLYAEDESTLKNQKELLLEQGTLLNSALMIEKR